MKKTKLILIAAILTCGLGHVSAQIHEDYEILFTDDEGKQEIIEVPEGMTDYVSALDSLLILFHDNALVIDDACESSDENPYYSDEVIAERLSRMPNSIEMPFNSVVRQFIDRYTNRMRRSVSVMLGTSNFYMPIFEQALESYNVPLELKYLPVIESALNPKAVSRVGATGLWQFMLATGKQYGLRVNSLVDDRRDPIRASYAAARYLRDLYRIFGDWTLAIAAYNCGPENVNKAIRRSGGSMDYYIRLCSALFQAVSKSNRFKDLKIYYFHNCIYQKLYTDPTCRDSKSIPTDVVLNTLDREYKLIIVGDAEMAPYELFSQRYVPSNGKSGLEWLREVRDHFSHCVWLNPSEGGGYWDVPESYATIKKEFDMYYLTVDNLVLAMKKLISAR